MIAVDYAFNSNGKQRQAIIFFLLFQACAAGICGIIYYYLLMEQSVSSRYS